MTKPEKKSITDLLATKPLTRKPSAAEIEKITQEIHEPEKQNESKLTQIPVKDKTKHISVNASIPLYIKAKTRATILDETLQGYVIGLIEADLKKNEQIII